MCAPSLATRDSLRSCRSLCLAYYSNIKYIYYFFFHKKELRYVLIIITAPSSSSLSHSCHLPTNIHTAQHTHKAVKTLHIRLQSKSSSKPTSFTFAFFALVQLYFWFGSVCLWCTCRGSERDPSLESASSVSGTAAPKKWFSWVCVSRWQTKVLFSTFFAFPKYTFTITFSSVLRTRKSTQTHAAENAFHFSTKTIDVGGGEQHTTNRKKEWEFLNVTAIHTYITTAKQYNRKTNFKSCNR